MGVWLAQPDKVKRQEFSLLRCQCNHALFFIISGFFIHCRALKEPLALDSTAEATDCSASNATTNQLFTNFLFKRAGSRSRWRLQVVTEIHFTRAPLLPDPRMNWSFTVLKIDRTVAFTFGPCQVKWCKLPEPSKSRCSSYANTVIVSSVFGTIQFTVLWLPAVTKQSSSCGHLQLSDEFESCVKLYWFWCVKFEFDFRNKL